MVKSQPSRRWRKLVAGLLFAFFILLVLTTAGTQVMAYLAIHPFRERLTRTPAQFGLSYEDVTFYTRDGVQLRGWFIPAAGGGATVILGHGFTRSRQELLDVAVMLNRHCYNVLLFDWRAHGQSGGSRTTFGYKEVDDLAAAVDYVAARPDVDPEAIGVLGKSLGAAIAIRGAADLPQLKAVVADSPFPTLEDSIEVGVRRRGPLGWWPLRPIALYLGTRTIGVDPDLVRPIDDIDDLSPRPVMIIHGGRDALVPADTGARLYDAAGDPKSLWYAPDAAHVELSAQQPAEYEARVIAFFDGALTGQCSPPARASAGSVSH